MDMWLKDSGGYRDAGSYFVMSADQLAALTSLFYGGRASPDFVRRDLDEIMRVFKQHGLIGDFWRLPS